MKPIYNLFENYRVCGWESKRFKELKNSVLRVEEWYQDIFMRQYAEIICLKKKLQKQEETK